jgi:GcrA cell cycle regulator
MVYFLGVNVKWTTEDSETAKRLWAEGRSGTEIGRMLGKTRSAVIGYMHRKSVKQGTRSDPLAPKPKAGNTKADKPMRPRAKAKPETHAPPPLVYKPVTLIQLRPSSCRWPLGEMADPVTFFCGKPQKPGKPYCDLHHKIAFQPFKPMARKRSAA